MRVLFETIEPKWLRATGVHRVDESEDVVDIQSVVLRVISELIVDHVCVEELGNIEEVETTISVEVRRARLHAVEVSARFGERFWSGFKTDVTTRDVVRRWVDTTPDAGE